MKDFRLVVEKGKLGTNKGIKSGFSRLDNFTSNLQMESYHCIGAAPKTGKTAYIDSRYVLNPYLLNPEEDIHWIYFSYEISRLKKVPKWISWFIREKYKKEMDPAYILSKGKHTLSKEDENLVYKVLEEDIIPLLGDYNEDGLLIKQGKIDFHERKTNPTGIRNYITNYFNSIGEYKEGYAYVEKEGNKEQIKTSVYKLKEEFKNRKTIIIVDHIALVSKERGFNNKENIDKLSEYFVNIRNIYKPLIVITQQFNRDIAKIERLKFSGEDLKPTKEDFKDSGNTAQDVDQLYSLFKPSIYPHIDSYLGNSEKKWKIRSMNKNDLFIHLLESRDTEGFIDLGCCIYGESGYIQELPELKDMTEEAYLKIRNKTY